MDSELTSRVGDTYAHIRGGLPFGVLDLIEEDQPPQIKFLWRFHGTKGGVSAQFAIEYFVSLESLNAIHSSVVMPLCRRIVQELTTKAKSVNDKH